MSAHVCTCLHMSAHVSKGILCELSWTVQDGPCRYLDEKGMMCRNVSARGFFVARTMYRGVFIVAHRLDAQQWLEKGVLHGKKWYVDVRCCNWI
jgi:hypothetical protein